MRVWRCHDVLNCIESSHRKIEVAKALAEVKIAIATGKLD
jgi:succinate dehydrogenase/fumarate reductase-like Fe-S protein